MFAKYSSAENSYQNRIIEAVYNSGLDKVEWVAREKIHGTNFSLLITENSIIPCKRSGEIEENEKFYNHHFIMEKYSKAFESVRKSLEGIKTEDGQAFEIQIYGEYAGDGIQVMPYGEKDFYVFDILVNGKFADDEWMEDICLNHGLKVAPLIKRGQFEELVNISPYFDTLIPKYNSIVHADGDLTQLSLLNASTAMFDEMEFLAPESEEVSLLAEGLMIKPCVPAYYNNGSRAIIKIKNIRFSEKTRKEDVVRPELTAVDNELLNTLLTYVNDNRLTAVLSKRGESTIDQFGLINKEFIQDAKDDFVKDHGSDAFSKIGNHKLFFKMLNNSTSTLVRQRLTNK